MDGLITISNKQAPEGINFNPSPSYIANEAIKNDGTALSLEGLGLALGMVPAPAPAPAPAPDAQPTYQPYSGGYSGSSSRSSANSSYYKSAADGVLKGASMTLSDIADAYRRNATAFGTELSTNQGNINRGLAMNELRLRQGTEGVKDKVGKGVKSGLAYLGSVNAGDSSAVKNLGAAYASEGNKLISDVTGEYAMQNEDLMREQGALNVYRDNTRNDLETYKATEINRVAQDARNKLDMARAEAASAGVGLPRSSVDAIINEAMGKLAIVDANLNATLAGASQYDQRQIGEEANRLSQLGAVKPFTVQDIMANATATQDRSVPLYYRGRRQ